MPQPTLPNSHDIDRRRLIAGALAGAAAATPALAAATDDLTWTPAWRLREMIVSRKISPVEVVDHFLARIERLNPSIGAFSFVNAEEARAAARAAEQAVMARGPLGPLHGLPVSFKDLVMVRGAPSPTGRGAGPAQYDDAVVERIRAAGGIVIGKTVMAGPPALSGAANPWNLGRVAGASSSGGAAATAAGLGPLAVTSDGGGSTRLPAAYCGVVGLHPTIGRVPRFSALAGGLPGWLSAGWSGSLGPTTRDARDSAMLLQVMAGGDWRTIGSFPGPAPDYQTGLEAGVRGMRMAWISDYGYAGAYSQPVTERLLAVVRDAAFGFGRLGVAVEDPGFRTADSHPVFMAIRRALETAGGQQSDRRSGLDPDTAFIEREKMAQQYLRLFERYDVLLSTTTPIIAPTRAEWDAWLKSPGFAASYTCLTGQFNTLGFPAIAVPCGFVDGMPVSLQIVGPPDADAKVLRVARAFLRAFPQTQRPAAS